MAYIPTIQSARNYRILGRLRRANHTARPVSSAGTALESIHWEGRPATGNDAKRCCAAFGVDNDKPAPKHALTG